ncbi:MAG: hypothetical protein DRN26_05760 [Thermoplasmata archaeon]|nr:MAG: hypothetical protein DRN26_05760 [Thermoplasmata archaeon]
MSIIIDSREANLSKTIYEKLCKTFNVQVLYLPAGDYLLADGVAVERKTGAGFYSDLISGRLWEQLNKLCECYQKPIVLIEGLEYNGRLREAASVCRAGISTILLHWRKIRLLFTKDENETVYYLKYLTSRISNPKKKIYVPPFVKKSRKPSEIRSYMLQCISGIGPKAAQRILEKFPTLEKLCLAKEEDLKKVVPRSKLPILVKVIKGER